MTGDTIATGGVRYKVYVDDVAVDSYSTQLHTALDRLRSKQIEHHASEVLMRPDGLLYRYEPSDEELEGIATDPADEEEPDDTDDGSEGTEDPPEETDPTEDGIIPTEDSKLTAWDDPTKLEHYQEYEPVEPKPFEMDGTLADIAADMQPGEWRGLFGAPMTVAASWADKAMWDQQRQRLSWLGHHGTDGRPTRWTMLDFDTGLQHKQVGNTFHSYAGIDNQWGYRSYGKYTQLADGSNVYARWHRLWKQDPETLEWSAWVMHPRYKVIANIEYFPEMGAVVSLAANSTGSDNTRFCAYYIDADEWRELPVPVVQGRHSMMRHNPVRGEVLLLGGDDSFRKAQILHADGSLTEMADAPRNTRIKTDQLAVDPVSGHYLNLVQQPDEARGKKRSQVEFFGLNPDANEWYLISEWTREASHVEGLNPPAWPFSSQYARPAVVTLPDHGVTIWVESNRSGVRLYKHVEV